MTLSLEAAQRRGRRAKAVLKAAFVVAMPFLTFPVVFGMFGLVIWACLFVPALLGIVCVQLPAKVLACRWDAGWMTSYFAVIAANVALTLIVVLVISDLSLSAWGAAALAAAATVAAVIWQSFDERALSGPHHGYSQGRYYG